MQKNNTLYVTTFNKALYEATGKRLIETFNKYICKNGYGDAHLLIAQEDNVYDSDTTHLILHDILNLESYNWLNDWLKKFDHIIPVEYGGSMPNECDCKNLPVAKHFYKDHVRRCPNLGFNRRASKWFRKVAALHDAVHNFDYERIIFVDCDAYFKQELPESYLDKVFGDNDVIFHLGEHRKRLGTGIESGFIGFQGKGGRDFLQLVFDSYESGDFQKYDRWDDGYIFRKKWEEHPEFKYRDVVGPHKLKPFSHVVRYGLFSKYIEHDKGIHTHKYKIFVDSTRL